MSLTLSAPIYSPQQSILRDLNFPWQTAIPPTASSAGNGDAQLANGVENPATIFTRSA